MFFGLFAEMVVVKGHFAHAFEVLGVAEVDFVAVFVFPVAVAREWGKAWYPKMARTALLRDLRSD